MNQFPLRFRETVPDQTIQEKWKECTLNTGGSQSTLQDIKFPERAGGYWYKISSNSNTRNRFIHWRMTSDAIELSEASMDVRLVGSHIRFRVSSGTPPLDGISVWEKPETREVIILVATVSSVHRLVFPHPDALQRKERWDCSNEPCLSIFHNASSGIANHPSNLHILSHSVNANRPPAHTAATLLRSCGEALFALACGGIGVLLVRLAPSGHVTTLQLKRESAMPRFLSGITGALRGRASPEAESACGVSLMEVDGLGVRVFALCSDACLRVWSVTGQAAGSLSCVGVSPPLTEMTGKTSQGVQRGMLRSVRSPQGEEVLVVFLCFANECEFLVVKPQQDETGIFQFVRLSHLYGPQLRLVDFAVSYSEEQGALWAIWLQSNGEALITETPLGSSPGWTSVAPRSPYCELMPRQEHEEYIEQLFAPGLFPLAVIEKALTIYKRKSGAGTGDVGGGGGGASLQAEARAAVEARVARVAAAHNQHQMQHIIYRCWSELYSWCVQYMAGLLKPLGLIVSSHTREPGSWCCVVRGGGVSLVRPACALERVVLAPDEVSVRDMQQIFSEEVELSRVQDVWSLVRAAAACERACSSAALALADARLHSATPHEVLRDLLQGAYAPHAPHDDVAQEWHITPQFIDQLTAMLEPVKDLQKAILDLNAALRLDSPHAIDMEDDVEENELQTLFSSDLGVSLVTEALNEMAEVRARVCRSVLVLERMLCASWPGAAHCAIHWQAYHAVRWLRHATLSQHPVPPNARGNQEQLARLKLSIVYGDGSSGVSGSVGAGVGAGASLLWRFVAGEGGARARRALAVAPCDALAWHCALTPYTHYLGHLVYLRRNNIPDNGIASGGNLMGSKLISNTSVMLNWGVNGGFEFGWWLASINCPRLVQKYVALLEPWCEWNACSRLFILGLSLLDTGDYSGAFTALVKASKGISAEPFLSKCVAGDSSTLALTPNLAPPKALLLYFLKVIKLLELHGATECVVQLAEMAISIADQDDPNLSLFYSVVFSAELEAGRLERAVSAAAANPQQEQRANAAERLLTALGSRGQLGLLLEGGAGALVAEVERAAECRARVSEPAASHAPYDFLYSLHLRRQNTRKAAAVMYERARRCAHESGSTALEVRRRCLLAAINCLSLTPQRHAFLAPGLTATDLRQELQLVNAAIALAAHASDDTCAFTGKSELVSGLVSCGLPTLALSLDACAALEGLAAGCAAISQRLDQQPAYENEAWQFINDNGITNKCCKEKSPRDAAWRLLQERVQEYCSDTSYPQIVRSVAHKLLSMGEFLPHWLLADYKKLDIGGASRAACAAGRVVEAGELARDVLLAALRTLPTSAGAPMCSPLTAVDAVTSELQSHLHLPACKQIYEELQDLTDRYLRVV